MVLQEPPIVPMNDEIEIKKKYEINTLKINGVVYHVPELRGKIERVKLELS